MKKLVASTLLVLALTLGFATASFAQGAAGAGAKPCATTKPTLETTFAPYVVGGITTAPGAAGQNYFVGIGVEHDGGKVYLDANGVYSSAAVAANPGQPHVGVFTLQGYYKLFGHVLAGGGATAVLNTGAIKTPKSFVDSARSQANPFVGAGLEFGRFRSIASYQIPVRGEGVPEQIKFNLNNELALTRHIRVGVPLTISSYRNGPAFKYLGGARVTVAQAGGELKLVW